MKPVESVGIGLLYYNKGLQRNSSGRYMTQWETLKASGLVARGEFIVQNGARWTTHEHITAKVIESGLMR